MSEEKEFYTNYLENRIKELESKIEKDKKKNNKQFENNTNQYTTEQILLNE